MIKVLVAVLLTVYGAGAAYAETFTDPARTLIWQGVERRYFLHLPEPAPEEGPMPVIVALHGVGQTPAEFANFTGFDKVGDRHRVAVIYPEGRSYSKEGWLGWNAGFCCVGRVARETDDVGFVMAALDDALAKAKLDRSRVFVTGFSNGAMLAYRIAAEHADRIAAIGISSGAIGGNMGAGTPYYQIPKPSRPVAVAIVHSLTDPFMIYHGGSSKTLEDEMHLRRRMTSSVADALKFWWDNNDCDSSDPAYDDKDVAVELSYGCKDRADVVLWTIKSSGHVWPGDLPMIEIDNGKLTVATPVSAAEAFTGFFLRYERAH
jgi:polyhydroxybutyrate depolymerase